MNGILAQGQLDVGLPRRGETAYVETSHGPSQLRGANTSVDIAAERASIDDWIDDDGGDMEFENGPNPTDPESGITWAQI